MFSSHRHWRIVVRSGACPSKQTVDLGGCGADTANLTMVKLLRFVTSVCRPARDVRVCLVHGVMHPNLFFVDEFRAQVAFLSYRYGQRKRLSRSQKPLDT